MLQTRKREPKEEMYIENLRKISDIFNSIIKHMPSLKQDQKAKRKDENNIALDQ